MGPFPVYRPSPQKDPRETTNLIHDPQHRKLVQKLRKDLHDLLVETDGAHVPFGMKRGPGQSLRRIGGSNPAEFPPEYMRTKSDKE